MTPIEFTQWYLSVGLPICLVNGGPGNAGKKPFGTTGYLGWQHNSDWTPDLVEEAYAARAKGCLPTPAAGIRLGPILEDGGGFIDIEFDGPNAEAELDMYCGDAWDEVLSISPPTWESPRGRHHLFWLDRDQYAEVAKVTRSGVLKGHHLEVRLGNADGSLQSVLPNGENERAWVDGCSPGSKVQLPHRVLECLLRGLKTQAPVAVADNDSFRHKGPGDYFNEREDWHDLLTGQGWTYHSSGFGIEYWTRPGKSAAEGISATLGFCESDHRGELFYSFSDSPEIEPLEARRSYSKFEFYVATRYGDLSASSFHAATKDVAERYVETRSRERVREGMVVENYQASDYEPHEEQEDDEVKLDLPLELVKFPGFVSDFADWHSKRCGLDYTYQGAIAGIAMQSWLMGRRVQAGGICPNLNLLYFGPSGSGKTRSMNSVKDLLKYLNRTSHYVAGFASGEAVEDELEREPHLFLIHEEVVNLFRGMGDSNRPHVMSFTKAFNDVSTAANSYIGVRKKASARNKKQPDDNLGPSIMQPHLTATFANVEQQAWEALPNTAGDDGFLARLLVFCVRTPGRGGDPEEDTALREGLLKHGQEWLEVKPPMEEVEGATDTIASIGFKLHEIEYTPDARELQQELKWRGLDMQRKFEHDPIVGSTWARDTELAVSLQLVMAGSMGVWPNCRITRDMVERSYEITRRMFEYKIARIKSKLVAESDNDRLVVERSKVVLEYLRKKGGLARRRQVLKGPLQRISSPDDERVLDYLTKREQVVVVKAKIGDSHKASEFFVIAGQEIPDEFEGKKLQLEN